MTDPKAPTAENLIDQYAAQLANHWEEKVGPLPTSRKDCERLIAFGIAAGMRQVLREDESEES
jgi:hypothetical protein